MLAFENETSRLEVTVRQIKNEILPNLPYQDMIQGDFKAGLSPDLIFFVRYFPDKKFVENYANAYTMIKAEFAVDALDVNKKTAAIAFQATCGKATPKYNPMKPDEKDLEKITIKNAESSGVSFLVM